MAIDREREALARRPRDERDIEVVVFVDEELPADKQRGSESRSQPLSGMPENRNQRIGLMAALSTPAGLRQAILLNELLGTPKGLQP